VLQIVNLLLPPDKRECATILGVEEWDLIGHNYNQKSRDDLERV